LSECGARVVDRNCGWSEQITLYVGLVAFAVIIITLCFVASLATSSPSDPTRRHWRAYCDRFLRLRDEPELPPEVTSSSSHPVEVDEPPSYEQALVMVRGVGTTPLQSGYSSSASLRCASFNSPAVDSRRHLIAGTAASDAAVGSSVTSSTSISADSTAVNDHVDSGSPPNYFEVPYTSVFFHAFTPTSLFDDR